MSASVFSSFGLCFSHYELCACEIFLEKELNAVNETNTCSRSTRDDIAITIIRTISHFIRIQCNAMQCLAMTHFNHCFEFPFNKHNNNNIQCDILKLNVSKQIQPTSFRQLQITITLQFEHVWVCKTNALRNRNMSTYFEMWYRILALARKFCSISIIRFPVYDEH